MKGWIYGVNPVREALVAGTRIKALYVFAPKRRALEAIIKEAAASGVAARMMHDAGFFDSKFPKGHQGIAAEVERLTVGGPIGGPASEKKGHDLESLLEIPAKKGEPAFFVIVDCIEDPRNLGAVLRSADASGAHGVVMQERRTASMGPEVYKTSAGAAEHVAACVVTNIKHAIDEMKEQGIFIIGAEAGGRETPWDADLSGPVALVIGSEGKGLRRTVREHCDQIVSLPMLGRVNSLNTSVAAGILFYELLRQRRK